MQQIKVEDVSVYYEQRCAIWGITTTFDSGMMTGILGPNGSGKSTLLQALLGVLDKSSGTVDRGGATIAYVPQRKEMDLEFPITIFEMVMMGAYHRLNFLKWSNPKERDKARTVLQRLGILEIAHRQIGEVSGGQLQRAIVARALMQDADFYILDEPFTGIDFATEKLLIEVFFELKQAGKGVILVHHDLTNVRELFDRVILVNGRLVAQGPTAEVFTDENIRKTFGERETLLEEVGLLKEQVERGQR